MSLLSCCCTCFSYASCIIGMEMCYGYFVLCSLSRNMQLKMKKKNTINDEGQSFVDFEDML